MVMVPGFSVGKHNGHPCPPRLLALAALSRVVAPPYPGGMWYESDTVTLPGHVVTGALRRGRMLGCVALMLDAEREMIRERSATAKRCLQLRPETVDVDEWKAKLAELLMSEPDMAVLEQRMAELAAEENERCSTSSSSESKS